MEGGLAWDTWQAVAVNLSELPIHEWRRIAFQDASEEGSVFIVDNLRLWPEGADADVLQTETGAVPEAQSTSGGDDGGPPGEHVEINATIATQPLVLISEEGLGEDVVDWSWNTSYLLYEPPEGVTAAIDGRGALSLKTVAPFSTDWWGASAIDMWISVVDPDVPLAIRLDAAGSKTTLDAFTLQLDAALGGTQLKPMQWTHVVIPLESLGPHEWDRVSLVVAEDGAQDVLVRVKRLALLPSKYFEAREGSSTISWILDDGDSTVPLYADDLYSGVSDWSWGAEVDFAFPLGEPDLEPEEGPEPQGQAEEVGEGKPEKDIRDRPPTTARGIKVETKPYGALSLRTDTPFHHGLVAERDHLEIEFWLYLDTEDSPPSVEAFEGAVQSGEGAALQLRLDAVDETAGSSSQIVATLPIDLSLNGEPGDEALPRGEWVHFQVPVRRFGDEAWDRISWIDSTGRGSRFVVDGVNLVHRRA